MDAAERSPLAIPGFRWLFAGNTAYFLATSGQALVRPYLAYNLTESPLALGFISAAMAVPMLVLSPFGGALADRFERRNLIIWAQSILVVAETCVFALLVLGRLEYWQLLIASCALGCSYPMSMPARHSIVMNIVGQRGATQAFALNVSSQNVTRVIGPAAAGFLIPVIGIDGVLGINLGLFFLSMFVMGFLPRFRPPRHLRSVPILHSLMEGFRYVREHRLVLHLLLYGLVPMFLAAPFQSLLVVFTEDVWHTGSRGLGILNAAIGIGGLAGALFVAARPAGAGRQRVMMLSALFLGGLLAGAAFSPWFVPAMALVFLSYACAITFGTLNSTAIQLLIPDAVRGRISSLLMATYSLPMLGTLPVSAAAEAVGAPLAVGVASALAMLFACAFYLASRELRQLDASIADAMRAEL